MFSPAIFARFLALFLLFSAPARADRLTLYIDADYAVSAAAAVAIELGVRTALNEAGGRLGGVDAVVVPRDHRGNVRRSRKTMERYLESEEALALIGGMHSPPYLTHQDFLNANRVLTLLPWSAAGPITRPSAGMENWIFRLSVDDRKSGEYLVREAVERGGCSRIALILLDTGWGRANFRSLSAALEVRGLRPSATVFFGASIGKASAGVLAEDIAHARADCAVLLTSWDAGRYVTNALYEQMPDLRVFSHWGVSGGRFADHVPYERLRDMQFSVLQTCGLREERDGNPVLRAALAAAAPENATLATLRAPSGFVHGYDLTRILIAAADQASKTPAWDGDIAARRAAVREALEGLRTPVEGILATYDPPFRPYVPEDPDAHEALGADDFCMARFREDGLLEHNG